MNSGSPSDPLAAMIDPTLMGAPVSDPVAVGEDVVPVVPPLAVPELLALAVPELLDDEQPASTIPTTHITTGTEFAIPHRCTSTLLRPTGHLLLSSFGNFLVPGMAWIFNAYTGRACQSAALTHPPTGLLPGIAPTDAAAPVLASPLGVPASSLANEY
jgi:hypothetical protein